MASSAPNLPRRCVESGCVAHLLYPIAWRTASAPHQPRFACSRHLPIWERRKPQSIQLKSSINGSTRNSLSISSNHSLNTTRQSSVAAKVDSGIRREQTPVHTNSSNNSIGGIINRPAVTQTRLRLKPRSELLKPNHVFKFISLTPNSKRMLSQATLIPIETSLTNINVSSNSTENSFGENKLASSFKESNRSTPTNVKAMRPKLIKGSPMSPIRSDIYSNQHNLTDSLSNDCFLKRELSLNSDSLLNSDNNTPNFGNSTANNSDFKDSLKMQLFQLSHDNSDLLYTDLTIKSIQQLPKGFRMSDIKRELQISPDSTTINHSAYSINNLKPNLTSLKTSMTIKDSKSFQTKQIVWTKSPNSSTTNSICVKPNTIKQNLSMELKIKCIKQSPVSRNVSSQSPAKLAAESSAKPLMKVEPISPKSETHFPTEETPSPMPLLNKGKPGRFRRYGRTKPIATRTLMLNSPNRGNTMKRALPHTPGKCETTVSPVPASTPIRPKLVGNINRPWLKTPTQPKPKKEKKDPIIPFQFRPQIARVRVISHQGSQNVYVVDENCPETSAPERQKQRVPKLPSKHRISKRPLFPANQTDSVRSKSIVEHVVDHSLDQVVDLLRDCSFVSELNL